MKPISSGEMAPAMAPRNPVTEKAMPRIVGGTTSVIITGMATRPPTMKATATPCTGMRNQIGTSRNVGMSSERADALAHAGEEHRRALVAVAHPVDDAARRRTCRRWRRRG